MPEAKKCRQYDHIVIDETYYNEGCGTDCEYCYGEERRGLCPAVEAALDHIHERADKHYPNAMILIQPKQYWYSLAAAGNWSNWREVPHSWYQESWR